MDTKRSPLKGKPLRGAGQSVQEQIDKIIDDKLAPYILGTTFIVAITGLEWFRYKLNLPYFPYFYTVMSAIAVIYCVFKIKEIKKEIKNLKLGRDGEKAVGQFLELLRQDGCIVFHDIVGDKFNLDHVIISPKGIFVIETKTYSKPEKKDARVYYDGTHLSIDGIGNKDDILIQVEAESNWLRETLKESTGKEFKIKPVVVFPGWYVENKNHKKHWVLNPKALPKFIGNENATLSKEDVKLISYHLSRYIRAL